MPPSAGEIADISLAHQMSVKNCFIRGSVVRYVQMPASAMDTTLLEDATRRGEAFGGALAFE